MKETKNTNKVIFLSGCGEPQIIDLKEKDGHSADFLRETIGCEYFDCRNVSINGFDYDLWFDDEFVMNDPTDETGQRKISGAWLVDGQPIEVIRGALIIADSDEEGKTIGLSDEKMANLVHGEGVFLAIADKVTGKPRVFVTYNTNIQPRSVYDIADELGVPHENIINTFEAV